MKKWSSEELELSNHKAPDTPKEKKRFLTYMEKINKSGELFALAGMGNCFTSSILKL